MASINRPLTHRQSQFVAFIHLYRKLQRRAPAETDLCWYFGLPPPTVHVTLMALERHGAISRQCGVPRSARLLIPAADIPELECVDGPPW